MRKTFAILCETKGWMFLLCSAGVMLQGAASEELPLNQRKLEALRRTISDLSATYPNAYTKGPAYLERINQYEAQLAAMGDVMVPDNETITEFAVFKREVLAANPLLSEFDRLLVVKRSAGAESLGLPRNWQGNCSLSLDQYINEIALLSPVRPAGVLTTLFRPEKSLFAGDVDLHFDGKRILFSMPGSNGRCQIWEIRMDGSGLRQVTVGEEDDVDNYDACYLPDGRIIFSSTANYQGVPCVSGYDSVANLCIMNADGTGVRQLCFDQDHNWCPTVLNNGRILYTRWEYTDTPHSNTRLLFHMNPDGTEQMEYYGSNSYWPTSVMYARPIPSHPTKVVAIVTGHHGVARMGELVVFDPALGRREAEGAVQRIPGFGKAVDPVIKDTLADDSWPKFLHPYPLSDNYFLVACQPAPLALWGIYLADVFDNLLLLREEPGYVLFEPIPVRATPMPPLIPDKIKPGEKEAVVYLTDVYAGQGLAGLPRGSVKSLRLISYVYAYRKTGGLLGVIGMDGPWDIKRVLGTVPVAEDGSALFRVPANTPISIQPLDEKGRALQLMRSWFTAMPGETVSCLGCHEPQNSTPSAKSTTASRGSPDAIAAWRGPVRGFGFSREVQPVLDRYCLSCHDGTQKDRPDLRGTEQITDWKSMYAGNGGKLGGKFSAAYASLHRYVRRSGIESDYHLLAPMEFHASTTELAQRLEKGHHGVVLDKEAWDRLNTWIDLNAPFHGTWTEIVGEEALRQRAERRRELLWKYANLEVDYETIKPTETDIPGTPLPTPEALPEESATQEPKPAEISENPKTGTTRTIALGESVFLELAYIPAGAFDMSDEAEGPVTRINIEKPFWMGQCEITNEQFKRFDPDHDSGVEPMHSYQFGIRGYPVNGPQQPVVRVSWNRAMEFCRWLSDKTGQAFILPTEAQWEYACRAGTITPFFFGGPDADFSNFANLGDTRLKEFARETYQGVHVLENPTPYDDWIPKDERFDDGSFLPSDVARYRPNPWGLYDMHGNASEWTLSMYRPYPYNESDGRNDFSGDIPRVVRGGSWYDRPCRATASYRLGYAPYQPVFNVGFRVCCPDG
ncbi:MAG TPA: SUMF1/EgtB/PvdO family nonheme iron enzyme [Candidatus Hydrogenedentes bacterium]|nr:SUMF1/EgtB/PvdO family nonheme iron enzyme [Candidatus Hydrogenedentota bacterium]